MDTTSGTMDVHSKASIKTTRNTVTVSIDGLMVENTQETGLEASNTDLENTSFQPME